MNFIDPSHIPATGNLEIDHDHQDLAGMMNRVYDAWQKGARCPELVYQFEELRLALISHFAKEITIARGAGYARWLAHHQEHKLFLNRFSDFMEECREQRTGDQTNIEMFLELERHLFEHEVMSDQEMWGLWAKGHPPSSSDRLIDWKPEYAVGIEQIDGQHQRLIRLLNEAHQSILAPGTPLPAILGRLRAIHQEALQHFRSEEQYFAQLPEPMADQHRASHEGLIVELKRALDDNDSADLERAKALTEGYLKFWLLDHIVNTDSRLRDYLK